MIDFCCDSCYGLHSVGLDLSLYVWAHPFRLSLEFNISSGSYTTFRPLLVMVYHIWGFSCEVIAIVVGRQKHSIGIELVDDLREV